MPSSRLVLAIGLLLALPGTHCAAGTALQDGPWRAWLETPAGELPFDLEIQTEGSTIRAWISNGDERVAVREVRIGRTVVLDLPHPDSILEGSPSRDGSRLDGRWRLQVGDRLIDMSFHATAGRSPRFLPDKGRERPGEDRPLPERWTIRPDRLPTSIALFHTTEGGGVRGTFMNTSDDVCVAGDFRGGRLRLSGFDGARAVLADAVMQADGSLVGWYWEVMSPRVVAWKGKPDPDARLEDPFTALRLDTIDLATVTVYDPDGNPHPLSEVHRTGDVLLLEILGTWCPTCYPASEFLVQLQRDYGDQGLEVVGLAFEMSQQFQRNATAVRRYREKYQLDYPIFLASNEGPISPSALLPPREGEYVFPTVLFLDSRNRIRAVHAGFPQPSSGARHRETQSRWRALVEEMLSER